MFYSFQLEIAGIRLHLRMATNFQQWTKTMMVGQRAVQKPLKAVGGTGSVTKVVSMAFTSMETITIQTILLLELRGILGKDMNTLCLNQK